MVSGLISPNLDLLQLRAFKIFTLKLESHVLRSNPWRDPATRVHGFLLPQGKAPPQGWPLVVVLAGFTGNGTQYFSLRSFEDNFVQKLDRCVVAGRAPRAGFLFVDAMTFWGGSQFINSPGMGRYQDHIVDELLPMVKGAFPLNSKRVCVMGGSSGGYGALHLGSKFPEVFPWVGAIAPDCFFAISLLPELYSTLPLIKKNGGIKRIAELMRQGRFHGRRDSHEILNSIAMGLCFAPHSSHPRQVDFPIDEATGELKLKTWKRWLKHDPLHFLPARRSQLRQLKGVYLDVGTEDQFQLQWGSRQIRKLLRQMRVRLHYSEFEGNHFDIGERRPQLWEWLQAQWR